MSFDIFFQTCRFGTTLVEEKNPSTGMVRSVLPSDPLMPSEFTALRAVLKKVTARGPDEFGCYVVQFPDGGSAEVFGCELEQHCMVAVRGTTPDLFRFLFDILMAGNWVMLPAMEDAVAITCSPQSVKNLPGDFPRLVVCNSADDLGILLSKGFGAWKKYRDQIVGDGK